MTKKLCIHIYQQIDSGIKKDKLIESNLNIEELFESDKERIDGPELIALKHIAQKAYDGNFFDITEIGDTVQDSTIESLLNKRLIIRSGANYNIYWDIFRDYLVTGEIPIIGESYLLRQGVNLCLEVLLLFGEDQPETVDSLLAKYSKNIGETTLENILIELRNIGLIKKSDEFFEISNSHEIRSTEGFKAYLFVRFQNYTPYLELKKLGDKRIHKDDITSMLKRVFKNEFKDGTWNAYAKNLIGWFIFAGMDISDNIEAPRKGRRASWHQLSIDSSKYLPRNSKTEIVTFLKDLKDKDNIPPKYSKDLFALGIIDEHLKLTSNGIKFVNTNDDILIEKLSNRMNSYPKMKKIEGIYNNNKKIKTKELIEILSPSFFGGKEYSSKVIYSSKALSWVRK